MSAETAGRIRAYGIIRESASFAVNEMRMTHTWRTYLFGWSLRLLLQTVFFALVGGFAGGRDALRYVLIGNAIVLGCLESMIVVLMMVQERTAGTLPLLATSPTSHVPIYIGRGLHWLASGLVSSTIAYVILPFALGVPLPWPRAILGLPMLIVTSLSSYCYGCALGAVALRHMAVTWLILNVGYLTVMTFCGVNVPVSFWPAPIHALTQVMPITHGLQAIRDMLAGASAGTVLGQLGLEVVVGAGWLAVAAVAIDRVVKHGVATGSLEFGT